MKVIAVSHGSYSKGLVDSVQMLVGEQENLVAYGLFPEQTVATLTEQLEREVNDTPEGEEILLIVFMAVISPVASTVTQMCQVYDNDSRYASTISVLTTLGAIVTMPLMVLVFQMVM